jgi:hypothetical protein
MVWFRKKYLPKLRNLYSTKAFVIFPCRFFVVHISPTRTRELNSQHQQSSMWVEGIHTTGCFSLSRRDRLGHCYHHLRDMRPSARCLTPWLRWTRICSSSGGCRKDIYSLPVINAVFFKDNKGVKRYIDTSNLYRYWKISAILYSIDLLILN